MITFGLYGSGWRSEFFLRVAKLLPEKFKVDGLITTNPEKKKRFEKEFDIPCYATLEEYLAVNKPLFMVESVNKGVSARITMEILKAGIPVLMETPAGADLETMERLYREFPEGAKIQIAEQYPFHPLHAARVQMIESGLLGDIQHTQVSFSHGYHGLALIRKFLGLGFENAKIQAMSFPVSVMSGVTRGGPPEEEKLTQEIQTVAVLDFGGKTALYSFEMSQHRSWVRSPHIQIKGEKGEIFNESLKYLLDFATPMESRLERINLGENQNVEGFGLKGIIGAGQWLYKNPYPDSRLSDDETAVAQCLEKMAHYVETGESFYSFAEGAQDMYLAIMIENAVKDGAAIRTQSQIWSK